MQAFTAERTELLATYGADAHCGLSAAQAQKNKTQYGENALTRRKPDSLLKRLWDAATEPMLLMLIAAGLIALAVNIVRQVTGGEADFLECVGVFVAIALSVVISVVMEGRSAKAFEALSKINADMVVRAVRVPSLLKMSATNLAILAFNLIISSSILINSFSGITTLTSSNTLTTESSCSTSLSIFSET